MPGGETGQTRWTACFDPSYRGALDLPEPTPAGRESARHAALDVVAEVALGDLATGRQRQLVEHEQVLGEDLLRHASRREVGGEVAQLESVRVGAQLRIHGNPFTKDWVGRGDGSSVGDRGM